MCKETRKETGRALRAAPLVQETGESLEAKVTEGCSEAGYCSIGETSGALGRPKETAESFPLLARQSLMVT